MNRLFRVFLAAVFVALLGMATGCTSMDRKDSSIPWSRPASWEGQIPGMGTPTGR
jgi:hypothetical protein